MPVIARFYGIVVKIFFFKAEHNPPHFHAIYGEYSGVFNINTLEMMEGDLPNEAKRLIKKWAGGYQKELLEIWNSQNFKELPWKE
ncbi:MAG TPA: DUF4160 domain-containing protein [bacterium]|nr:DUF4160 domain-containing protein [bacterium]HPS31619.1 DUF4160 domain-containing protein [bacterium]HRZ78643.1 DUF4160 domain-containing protein [bacterium]